MSKPTPQPPLPPTIPVVNFQNVIVNVTEFEGALYPSCVQGIPCTTRNTIINFQIAQRSTPTCDYRFVDMHYGSDDNQISYMISRDGKMLTFCDLDTQSGTINIILKVRDALNPDKTGILDPEVANQPDGVF